MKKGRIVANVIYYLFTFTIGVLLAIFLPFFMMLYGESFAIIEKSLSSGDYSNAISIVGGYYNDEPVFQADFPEGGGIVLFSSASLYPGKDAEKNTVDDMYMHKAYNGFVYGLKGKLNVTKDANDYNKAGINVIDFDGVVHKFEILDTDTNNDAKNDTNSSCVNYGFMYVDFNYPGGNPKFETTSIAKIELVDCDGNVYTSVETHLDYSEQFFADVNDFIVEYNANFNSENLNGLHDAFIAKSEHYKQSSVGVVKSSADKKSAIIVVVYFVVVYLIGDSLIGGRYVIRFFKWILVKVFKVKFKTKKPKNKEAFGHDYYCKFTLIADVSAVEDFETSIQVKYSNEKGEAQFTLMKGRNYADTQQIKAGEYVNLWIDLDHRYIAQDLPDTLEVEGYQKQITFKILKRED